jgi:RNA polymerase sigma factor (sigma-70 family)
VALPKWEPLVPVDDRSDVNLTHSAQQSTGPADEGARGPVLIGRRDFDTVYATLWPEMVRVGRLLTGSQTAGEEVAQDAFVGLYRHFDRVDNPAGYLRRSIANGARSAHRRRREHETLADDHDTAVAESEIDETWRALRVLTDRQRAVVVLRFYNDLTLAQIADALDCRVGTVKSTLSRSMTVLRKELS